MAGPSKAWVFDRSRAGIVVSNPARGHGCLSLVFVVKVEASATGRSLVQRSSRTEGGVSKLM